MLTFWRGVLVWLGSGLTVVAGLDYLCSALKGEVKPNRVTWFFWFVIPLIGALGSFLVLATVSTWRIENFLYPLYFGMLSLVGLILTIETAEKQA